MFDYRITFESPYYLLLALLVPALWWTSYRSLAVLGPLRRSLALMLRSLVLLLLVFGLAEIQMVRISHRLTVIYLLDQSMSIPTEQRRAMIEYTNAAILKHRQQEDRVGVIVFGRDAAIEIPPFDDDVQMTALVESLLDPDFTNLESAVRLAQASFPEDASRRIVVISDGNENIGAVAEQARALAAMGVGMDVVPVRYQHQGEVMLERLAVPGNIRRGQPFDLSVVATNTSDKNAGASGDVSGRLVIRKWVGDQSIVVSEDAVTLPPGKRVYTVRQTLDEPGFYTYESVFLPDNEDDDAMRQNNRATTFTHVRGKGQVLLIEDFQRQGEYTRLAQSLRRQNLEVTLRTSDQAFSSLAELQQYDTVLLANVPREDLTDAQVGMLVRNTQQLGAGLVMLGAPNSFGAGGWANTELEKAMPVDFQIKSAKVVPTGALAMVMHASEMARGNFWQKKIAEEALKALGPRDYCGVVHYDNVAGCKWLWSPGLARIGGSRNLMLSRIGRMTPGDMPDFDPGLKVAASGFAKLTDASVKHMIIISDGDPSPPTGPTLASLKRLNVTVSTVAVGSHGLAGSSLMRKIADQLGGKYYVAKDPKALPKIFQREARRVAQPLVYENSAGIRPQARFPHEMIRGIDSPLPPITGYVMSTKKENPLVEVSLVATQPGAERNGTILASWNYGLGRAVAFTTDAGSRYTTGWTAWENYDKLFSQIIAWSMRPTGDEGKFSVATDTRDGEIRVVVTALDKEDDFLNFLDMSGTVVGPDLKPLNVEMEQVAPGRYVGTFPGQDAGSYFVMVSPGAGKAPIRTGINVPYSDEFRGRVTNESLLRQLADMVPEGGKPGRLIEGSDDLEDVAELLKVNSFRHDLAKATSAQDAWFYLALIASGLFFGDVFVRRVQVNFDWLFVLIDRVRDKLFNRDTVTPEEVTIERLRNRKAEVENQVEQLKAGARFDESDEAIIEPGTTDVSETFSPTPKTTKEPGPSLDGTANADEESYTERLLKAKKKAWEERNKGS